MLMFFSHEGQSLCIYVPPPPGRLTVQQSVYINGLVPECRSPRTNEKQYLSFR